MYHLSRAESNEPTREFEFENDNDQPIVFDWLGPGAYPPRGRAKARLREADTGTPRSRPTQTPQTACSSRGVRDPRRGQTFSCEDGGRCAGATTRGSLPRERALPVAPSTWGRLERGRHTRSARGQTRQLLSPPRSCRPRCGIGVNNHSEKQDAPHASVVLSVLYYPVIYSRIYTARHVTGTCIIDTHVWSLDNLILTPVE